MPVALELMEILACPKCGGELALTAQADGLVCAACALVYPLREDIPVMLVEEAVTLGRWEAGERKVKS